MIEDMNELVKLTKEFSILYVEDNEALREQTTLIFEMLFGRVETAAEGEEGWQRYQKAKNGYDIVFTDISMPKMDGLELSVRIKEENPKQLIVIISAYNTSEYLFKALECGVDAFLLKPIEMNKMMMTIEKLVSILHGRKSEQEYQKRLEKEVEEKTRIIQQQLVTDSLTGLNNRYALIKTLEKNQQSKALILFDIDNFDSINTVYGYETGDKVITALAKLLRRTILKRSELFYVGDDEFAVLCDTTRYDVEENARALQRVIENMPVEYQGQHIELSVSVGIATQRHDLLKHAYIALREAKRDGNSSIKLYSEDLPSEKLHAQIQKFSPIIKDALEHDYIVPYFQGIVDNETKKIVKYECLARIVKDGTLYTPYHFIEIAKKIGLLPEITKVMIEKSFRTFAKNDFDFSINITEADLSKGYLPEYLLQKFQEYSIAPSRVILEVLEGISVKEKTQTLQQLLTLKEIGCRIAIDDFGAEQSNFERVLTMKVDFIKIDGSFIKHIDTDPKSYTITKTIADFARSIDAEVVAEFVHSQKVAEVLQELDIKFLQGFLYSEPKPELVSR